ncbi:Regulatory solute carrier protein family 1 member 1 [Bienertia sinuspersici]
MNDMLIDQTYERIPEEESENQTKTKQKKGNGSGGKPKPRVKIPVRRKLPTHDPSTLAATTTFSNAPVLENPNLPLTSSNNTALIVHRIPKTTAARRGLINTVHENEEARVIADDEWNRSFEFPHNNMYGHGETSMQQVNVEGGNDDLERETDRGIVSDVEDEEFGEIKDNYDPYADDIWENELLDDDTYVSKMYKNGDFIVNAEFGSIILKPWMIFTDKSHFLSVLRDYCIQSGFALVVDRSSPTRFTANCLEMNCNWRIHASVLPDGTTWAIKSIKDSEHTCRGLNERNPLVNVKWAASRLIDNIRANNDIPGKTLNELLWERYRVEMATSTLYKMRSIGVREINGGHDESYGKLPRYCEMVKQTNPGSAAFCAWTPQNDPQCPLTFSSIFISFKGAIDGLGTCCRSLVGVDGAHLKGNYGGVLLSAVAIDANNELYPFAWAIVPGEDGESWKFFMWHLKNILKEYNRGNDWCIISDRQKGIDVALTEIWAEVGRRYCCKHLAKNSKAAFPGPLMHSLFWLACSATSTFTFKNVMDRMQKINPLALVWLSKLGDQESWTRHKFDPKICTDENKTNFVESFNATLGVDRNRPVLTLLEAIRRMTMVRMSSRRKKCQAWNDADPCPTIVKRIRTLMHDSRTCKAFQSKEEEYEIREGRSMLQVSLNNKSCICGAWQITGIPCRHALRAIIAAGHDPHHYVSTWYSVATYKQCYSHAINSIPDAEHWPEIDQPTIHAPTMKRGIGRPSRQRKRADDEPRKEKRSTTVKCSLCKQYGHNSRTCKGGLTAKEKATQSDFTQQHRNQKKQKINVAATFSQPSAATAASSQAHVSTVASSQAATISSSQPPAAAASSQSSQSNRLKKGKEKV